MYESFTTARLEGEAGLATQRGAEVKFLAQKQALELDLLSAKVESILMGVDKMEHDMQLQTTEAELRSRHVQQDMRIRQQELDLRTQQVQQDMGIRRQEMDLKLQAAAAERDLRDQIQSWADMKTPAHG